MSLGDSPATQQPSSATIWGSEGEGATRCRSACITASSSLAPQLPQKYLAVVHNPELLNSTVVTRALVEGDVGVLSIAPHVLTHIRKFIAGLKVRKGIGRDLLREGAVGECLLCLGRTDIL